jgi:hypothetical protein
MSVNLANLSIYQPDTGINTETRWQQTTSLDWLWEVAKTPLP